MSHELRAAFELGTLELFRENAEEYAKAAALHAAGKSVVLLKGPGYCRHTDAIAGTRVIALEFADLRSALTYINEFYEDPYEGDAVLYPEAPKPPAPKPDPIDWSDCPF